MTIVGFASLSRRSLLVVTSTTYEAATAEATAEATADNVAALIIIDDNHSGTGILSHGTTEIRRRLGKITKILSSPV